MEHSNLMSVTPIVKDILKNYDENDLITTIPMDYELPLPIVNIYAKKIERNKNNYEKIKITFTEQTYERLENLINNNSMPISIALAFNFLVENVVNCSKINTKKIKHALDCYYYAVNHDRALFSEILKKYGDSPFYNDDRGLCEGDIAHFLTISKEGEEIIKKWEEAVKEAATITNNN